MRVPLVAATGVPGLPGLSVGRPSLPTTSGKLYIAPVELLRAQRARLPPTVPGAMRVMPDQLVVPLADPSSTGLPRASPRARICVTSDQLPVVYPEQFPDRTETEQAG